jgi:hypothetical protein
MSLSRRGVLGFFGATVAMGALPPIAVNAAAFAQAPAMPITAGALSLSEIIVATLRGRTGKLADNIAKHNALLRRIREDGKQPLDADGRP